MVAVSTWMCQFLFGLVLGSSCSLGSWGKTGSKRRPQTLIGRFLCIDGIVGKVVNQNKTAIFQELHSKSKAVQEFPTP